MKILRKVFMAALSLVLLVPAAIISAAPPEVSEGADTILVAFRPGASTAEIAALNHNNNAVVKDLIPALRIQVLSFAPGKAAGMLKVYQNNPNVIYAEFDAAATADEVSDDTYTAQQWGLAKINAAEAWAVNTGSNTIKIAILDTGIDLDHPDLAAKIVASINYSTSTTSDDVKGHGTHVAGIAAAIPNNGLGVAGLGYATSLMNVKVLGDDGTGSYSAIANGIIWAADNGADVINMSLSGSAASITLENAVNYAWNNGVVVVSSAGNNGNSTPVYPAYYANAFAVASTDSTDSLSGFSNFGDWVDIAAPGSSIMATLINGSYGYKSGSSMAAPFVSGLAALVASSVADSNSNGRLNDEIRAIIEASADNIGVNGIGAGRINAAAAVTSFTFTPIQPVPELTPEPPPEPAPELEVPVVTNMWVSDISFVVNGKNLVISVKAINEVGPVTGAVICFTVSMGNSTWQYNGITDNVGSLAVTIIKPAAGIYVVTINEMNLEKYEWDYANGLVKASYEIIFSSVVGKLPKTK
ncbi:S8 family peptidase [Dehalogenimonas sp. THU2]|uniref:S8 family peptidase n=1 Tax=Dehalogenimonas sp. THU2 TaxID=3151121 RepID=UPI003218DBA9